MAVHRVNTPLSTSEKQRRTVKLLPLLSIALFLVCWEISSHIIVGRVQYPNVILPSLEHVITTSVPSFAVFTTGRPQEDINYGIAEWVEGLRVIADASAHTVLRVMGGTLLGVVLGIGVGLLLYYSKILSRMFKTTINMTRAIPILALMPLFLLWFGNAEVGGYIYVAFGTFVMIVVNTLNAVSNIPPNYIYFARTLGAHRFQILRFIVVPAIVPELTGALRVIIGVSWMITVAAELIAEQQGLGRLLLISQRHLNTGRMIVIVILFGVFSLLVSGLYVKVSGHLTRWQPSKGIG